MPTRPATIKPKKQKAPPTYKIKRTERAFGYSDRRWQMIRRAVLGAEPLCRECAKHDRITPATDVDHIDGNPKNNGFDNLQPLCKPCHSRKTALEVGWWG